MNARLQRLLDNLLDFVRSQPPGRRALLLGTGVLSMALVLAIAWWVQRPVFRPLFTNLAEHDAAAIVAALRDEKVPYQLADGGRAVLVPAERLYELRLALASRGLPEGGGVGFEVFDRQSLGQTDFLQHLNFQRALQGELARTIAALHGVESARVHLALPERSLFVAHDRRPSASVVVTLARGRTLAQAQIDGIVHLVAASVEGMTPEAVTVVDASGRILTAERERTLDTGLSEQALAYQRAIERAAEERVETLLATVVGRDKVTVRVSARLDLSRAERTEERWDPEGAVVKESHTTREDTRGGRQAGGAAGAQSNLTNDPMAVGGGEGPSSTRREERQSWEISKIVSRTVAPVGTIQQLSVAVLVDGTYTEDNGKRTFVPRPQEELDRLGELVKSAVGLDESRGDRLSVESAPFQEASADGEGSGMLAGSWSWLPALLLRLLAVGVALVLVLLVVKPLLLALAVRRATGAAAALELGDLSLAVQALTQENLALAQERPERAAQLVREWLAEEETQAQRAG